MSFIRAAVSAPALMDRRPHLLSSLAALATAVIAGAAAWVVGPALISGSSARSPGSSGASQPDPDWWHQRGAVCNPNTLHEAAGFPLDPVSSSVPSSSLGSLPTYPGAVVGPMMGGPERREWLVGAWRVNASNASDLVHNGYSCNGAYASRDFSTRSDADIVAGWYERTLKELGYHTAIAWGKDWDPRGRGTRVFRRGTREWLELSFTYASDGRAGARADLYFHGRLIYTIAPSPCDGLSGCGLYQFSGSLGT